MIAYFSGTGNSRYVASELGRRLSLPVVPVLETSAEAFMHGDDAERGLVFPVYSWGVPAPIIDLINEMRSHPADAPASLWVVMTCGDETGDAPAMLRALLSHRGIKVSAIYSVIMPNNYVLLPGFDVDDKATEQRKLDAAPARIGEIAEAIAVGNVTDDFTPGPWPRLRTRLVYPLFRRWGINPGKFRAEESCIRCGRCMRACPLDNVKKDADGRPRWGRDCVSCLACYHVCPEHAVRYGTATERKGQYFCPFKG